MDSIDSILSARPKSREPREVQIIKDFMTREFNATCAVTVRDRDISITVANSALANMLQMRLYELTELCQTKKKLFVRTGGAAG